MRIILIYATVEGHTRSVARHVETYLTEADHTVDLVDATHPPESIPIDSIDAVICAGPIHIGTFPAPLRRFVRSHARELMARPGAFVTVSLTAASDDAREWDELNGSVNAFSDETGWWPVSVHNAAGALKYSEYDYFRKWMMRRIADKHQHPTDASQDYEFTDWGALDMFLDGFLRDVPAVAGKV